MRSVLSRLLSVPLRIKVLTAVGTASLVALLVGVVGLVQLSDLEQRSADVNVQALKPTSDLAQVRRSFLQTRIDAVADELMPGSSDEGTEHQAYLADVQAMDAAIAAYEKSNQLTEAQAADLATMQESWAGYQTHRAAALELIRAGHFQQYMAYRTNNTKPVAGALNDALTSLEESTAAQADATVAAARSTYESARTLILVVLVVGLVAAVALALFVAQMAIRPVAAVRNGLMARASGDLTAPGEVPRPTRWARRRPPSTRPPPACGRRSVAPPRPPGWPTPRSAPPRPPRRPSRSWVCPRRRSARWSARSHRSPSRPTCWR